MSVIPTNILTQKTLLSFPVWDLADLALCPVVIKDLSLGQNGEVMLNIPFNFQATISNCEELHDR